MPRGKPMDDEQRRARLQERYPGMLKRLGVDSDSQIARDHGVTRALVGRYRSELEIDPAKAPAPVPTTRLKFEGEIAIRDATHRVIARKTIAVSVTVPAATVDASSGVLRAIFEGGAT